MRQYKPLKNQVFTDSPYALVPIRDEDRHLIRTWRNEQIYHLRQDKPLTVEAQDNYFANTVASLFDQTQPTQLLFSYLEGNVCIGYGGLVHINWIDKHAEISFIINTSLEKDFFEKHWSRYLALIEQVAFRELNFHKIFVYAFDVRPRLYPMLIQNNFFKDAVLREHCYFNDKFIDVVIHSKLNAQ